MAFRVDNMVAGACTKLLEVRDALAHLAACTGAGDAASIVQAVDNLHAVVPGMQTECGKVSRLVRHMGVHSLGEAAEQFCAHGRKDTARALLDMQHMLRSLQSAYTDLGETVEEGRQSLDAASEHIQRHAGGGRFLGKA